MSIVIFTGPSIPASEASTIVDATFLPPAGQGDVYRVARAKPSAIGLIDGTFETSPAVWHKEILWALSEGIHLFGSASMGALRAAELAAFGMEGVGVIYEWFRSGTLEDDDEVAVAHADASCDFRVASEAMVNIRATVAAAVQAGAIGTGSAASILQAGKALHYRERTYPSVIRAARADMVSECDLDAFATFLARGRVNQKKSDAIQMLRVMGDRSFDRKRTATFHFQHTDTWDQVVSQIHAIDLSPSSKARASVPCLLEELQLRGQSAGIARRGVMLRALADREARRKGLLITPELRDQTQDAFRREWGLEESAEIWRWLERNQLTEATFGELLESEAKLRWLETLYGGYEARHVIHELIVSGEFEDVQARVIQKEKLLSSHGLTDPDMSETGISLPELLRWFFEERLGRAMPTELGAYLREGGFRTLQDLIRVALREYTFLKLLQKVRPIQEKC